MTEPRRGHNATFAVLALAGISYPLLQSLVLPALPNIQHSLHTSENSVSWVLTAYLLSASVATPLIGRLGDMYGKERLLVARAGAPLGRDARLRAGRLAAADAHRPRDPGRRRRDLPARVRDHPRRVPARASRRRDRPDVRAARGRRRRRRRSRGADRRPPLVPLPLLAAADPDRPGDGAHAPRRPRVADPRAEPDQLARRRADERWVGRSCCSPSARRTSWHWLSAKTLVCLGAGLVVLALWVRARGALARAPRRHADDADPRGLDDEHGRAAARLRDVRDLHPRSPSSSRRRPVTATASAPP